MKRIFLSKLTIAAALLIAGSGVKAQIGPNYNLDFGERFEVTAPASIAGAKNFTVTNSGTGSTADWARAVDTNWINIPVERAQDSLACGISLFNGTSGYPTLVGKFALIFRGNCEFGAKAVEAYQKGARGVIIVNNRPSDGPIAMGAGAVGGTLPLVNNGTTLAIPVIMVSFADGIAMDVAIRNNVPVTITLAKWSSGVAHDLAIVNNGISLSHDYAIPASQLVAANGNPTAYKAQSGAFVANFGSSNETGVTLKSNINWTPTGGAATSVFADSVTGLSISTHDSVKSLVTAGTYDFHATGNGRFDVNYTVSMANTDLSPTDNNLGYSMYVTDSLYSKGRYDFTNGYPIANGLLESVGVDANGVQSSVPFSSGPLFYAAKGGSVIKNLQFSLVFTSTTGPQTMLSGAGGTVTVNIFKWKDANNDGFMGQDELTILGSASEVLDGTADTSYQPLTRAVQSSTNILPRLEDNTYYWVAADMPGGNLLLCADASMDYYPRTYMRKHATPSVNDFSAPFIFNENSADLSAGASPQIFINMVSMNTTNNIDSAYFANQVGAVPAIAMLTTKGTPTGINTVESNIKSLSLYPLPATDNVTANFDLRQAAKNISYNILDGYGKTIIRQSVGSMQNGVINVNTKSLPSGHYYFMLNADGVINTRPFTIVK